MLIYILAVICAAVLQIGTIYFTKGNFLRNFLLVIPLIVIYQFLFLWSYANAPKFILIWFITAAITSSLAFFVSYFVFKETVTVWNIIGIVCILVGLSLLRLK